MLRPTVESLLYTLGGALVLLLVASPSAAVTTDERNELRRKQILSAIGDPNENAQIDEQDLTAFLFAKRKMLIASWIENLANSGLVTEAQASELERSLRDRVRSEDFEDELEDESIRIVAACSSETLGELAVVTRDDLRRFETQVVAPFGTPLAKLLPEATRPPPPEKSFLDQTAEWIKIRRSFLDAQGIARPGTFSLSHFGTRDDTRPSGRDDTVYRVQAAFLLHPERWSWKMDDLVPGHDMDIQPLVSWEGDISSDSEAGESKIIHRLGITSTLFRESESTSSRSDTLGQSGGCDFANAFTAPSGHNVDLTANYLTDRQYDGDQYGFTFQWSPNNFGFGIGRYCELAKQVHVRWRPYVGLDWARVTDPGDNPRLASFSDYTHLFVRSATELRIAKRMRVTPALKYTQDLQNGEGGSLLFSLGARISLDEDDRISLEGSYQRGEEGPDFIDKDSYLIGLGLKF